MSTPDSTINMLIRLDEQKIAIKTFVEKCDLSMGEWLIVCLQLGKKGFLLLCLLEIQIQMLCHQTQIQQGKQGFTLTLIQEMKYTK